MTGQTTSTLYKVRDKLQECRNIIDNYLYFSSDSVNIPKGDLTYCRKVYAAICKAMDLL